MKNLQKAIKNFPNPFLWYGGKVRIQAKLKSSGEFFSLEKYPTIWQPLSSTSVKIQNKNGSKIVSTQR